VLESLEEALVAADVGAETAAALADSVRARAGGSSARTSRPCAGSCSKKSKSSWPRRRVRRPAAEVPLRVVFLVGVNGTGKTTTTAKIAAREKASGRSVLLAAADTFRAGAIEQLQTWADRLDLPMVRHREGADPSAVLFDALSAAKARGVRTLLVDTAGRLHTKQTPRTSSRRCGASPGAGAGRSARTLLVLDATTGVNGLVQARRFVEAAGPPPSSRQSSTARAAGSCSRSSAS
jgi:fused signal recognition particle receptor